MTTPVTASTSTQLSVTEHNRLRRAATQATHLWPGPVGQLVARELIAVDECGRAFGGEALVARLVDAVEAAQRARVDAAARQAFRGFAGTASEMHR